MAVVENAGINIGAANRTDSQADVDQSKANHARASDQSFQTMSHQQQQKVSSNGTMNHNPQMTLSPHGINGNGGVQSHQVVPNGVELRSNGDDGGEGFKQEMRDLEEMLSKLNPMAEEFVPPSLSNYKIVLPSGHLSYTDNFGMQINTGIANGNTARRKNSYNNGKRRMNSRTSMAQRDDVIRRTVYVSDIDHQVTEEQLAALFISCGQVVDCRVCGDPNSVLRFAFIEFTDEEGARNALSLAGTMLGFYPVRVLPSKTAIAPVNPTFLPRSEDEREMCARTIYCTNIDKKVTQADVKLFFESICGEVQRLRLLGDYRHSTRIAFVEFVMAESAIDALNCSGAVLGSLPIRVSPSKTPVRPRAPRALMH
ncbi:polyadenylate-binding protein-interacting protein 11-like isoform X2 [Diospyros lotus]|uniref:polyadenylate-binding protein-interacting protein 11-like isoform X2 n=1 Tax=Diospyros lotus TaxID=55363 RepID=UPI00225BCCD2|nr:polyadenylate-binding protein-interacting protein 11-like isoform X2 [Diospyros lotus]